MAQAAGAAGSSSVSAKYLSPCEPRANTYGHSSHRPERFELCSTHSSGTRHDQAGNLTNTAEVDSFYRGARTAGLKGQRGTSTRQPWAGITASISTSSPGAPEPATTSAAANPSSGSDTRMAPLSTFSATTSALSPFCVA